MVRQCRCEATFPDWTPQEFFDAIYADEASMKLYLKMNTVQNAFSVSTWNENTRIVEFTKELKLPAAIAAVTGSSSLPVKDTQKLTQQSNGEFTVSSTPIVQMSIGSSFRGTTELTARWEGQGCLVEVVITCEADGPWGMINLIESFMEEEAKSGVQNYLTFCETRLADLKSDTNSGGASQEDTSNSEDQFFDVKYETLSQVSTPLSETLDSNGSLTTDALIALRLKRLEEDGQLTANGIEKILTQMEVMEQSFARTQRSSYVVIAGLSALSIALGASLIAMKYHHD